MNARLCPCNCISQRCDWYPSISRITILLNVIERNSYNYVCVYVWVLGVDVVEVIEQMSWREEDPRHVGVDLKRAIRVPRRPTRATPRSHVSFRACRHVTFRAVYILQSTFGGWRQGVVVVVVVWGEGGGGGQMRAVLMLRFFVWTVFVVFLAPPSPRDPPRPVLNDPGPSLQQAAPRSAHAARRRAAVPDRRVRVQRGGRDPPLRAARRGAQVPGGGLLVERAGALVLGMRGVCVRLL